LHRKRKVMYTEWKDQVNPLQRTVIDLRSSQWIQLFLPRLTNLQLASNRYEIQKQRESVIEILSRSKYECGQ